MINIFPFKGLLPLQETAKSVAAPPYDVMTRKEAEILAENNPNSFLRVSRSELELPAEVDPYSNQVYDRALDNFNNLQDKGVLVFDSIPSFYVYSLTMNGRVQSGLVAAASVDDYDSNRIKKHELTRKDKEDDRTRHIIKIRSHTGPVFLACKPDKKITEIINTSMSKDPCLCVDADDGIRHKIWRVAEDQSEIIKSIFHQISALYIADGHHRAKSAGRTRETLQQDNSNHTGNEDYNRFLSVIFPADQLEILAYNRVVKDLNGLSEEQFLSGIEENFRIEKLDSVQSVDKKTFHMYLNHTWYCLRPKTSEIKGSIVEDLDVSILQNRILNPILGIDDPRTNKRIGFVGGIHGTKKLEQLVDNGESNIAFALHPVTINELMDVSDADMIMPPKSTWFEPKLRDGLVCHCF